MIIILIIIIITIIVIIIIFDKNDRLVSLYKTYFILFFSCSLICTMMDERTESMINFFFHSFFISWMRFYKKSVVKYPNAEVALVGVPLKSCSKNI